MLAVICCVKWLFWPVSVAVMARIGRYVPCGVAVLARIAGRYEPCWRYLLYEVAVLARIGGRYHPYWPLFAARGGCAGPCRWLLWPVLAVNCRMPWLFWPVSLAVMSRTGRYLLYEVAALARIGGRYGPCWPVFAAWRW